MTRWMLVGWALAFSVLLAGCQLPLQPTADTALPLEASTPNAGPAPEQTFSLRFEVLDAAARPLPGARVEVKKKPGCETGQPCPETLVFAGETDAAGFLGGVQVTGPYRDSQVLLSLLHKVYIDGALAARIEERAPNTYTVYAVAGPEAKNRASALAAERQRQEALATAQQARARDFPFEGRGSFEGKRFKLVVGEGYTTSDGRFAITLDLLDEAGSQVSSRQFREGEDERLFVDSTGAQILKTGFLVERIYRKVTAGGAEIYSATIR